jgi:antitoxin PrlF
MTSASKVRTKGQVTIPKEVRERLRVQAGDVLVYEFQEDGLPAVRKMEPFDAGWTAPFPQL